MEYVNTPVPEVNYLVPYWERLFTTISESFPKVGQFWRRHYSMNCHNREEISVVSCVFIYFVALIFLYLLYAKCLQGLLKRMELAEINRSYLLEALWYVGLCGASIPSCMGKLMLDYNLDSLQKAYYTFFNDKAFVTEDRVPNHLVFLFILFCALSAHSVWLSWSKDGFNVEFFTRLCFFLFFSTTYSLRCVLLGLVCMLLININAVCAEITRILCILNSKRSLRTYSGKYISYMFFLLYFVFWSAAFLYVLPTRVLRRTISMHVRVPEDIPALVLLNTALWGFFWLQLLWAPASMAVQHLAWKMGRRRTDLLDAVLFPSRDALLAELRALRLRIRQQQAEELRAMNEAGAMTRVRERQQSPETNKKTLFQTVKCVMALKRRLRNRRLRDRSPEREIPEDIVADLMGSPRDNSAESSEDYLTENSTESLAENLAKSLVENLVENSINDSLENSADNLVAHPVENPLNNLTNSGVEDSEDEALKLSECTKCTE